MTPLAKRLLASIENHGKSDMRGIYRLYAHESKEAIDTAIAELDTLGWVHLRPSQVIDGVKKDIPNVRRSSKQMFTEQTMFEGE